MVYDKKRNSTILVVLQSRLITTRAVRRQNYTPLVMGNFQIDVGSVFKKMKFFCLQPSKIFKIFACGTNRRFFRIRIWNQESLGSLLDRKR